jgi:hypothetical protein
MTKENDKTTHNGAWGKPQSPRYTENMVCPVWQHCTKPQCFKHGCLHAVHFQNKNQSTRPDNQNLGENL